MLMFIIIYNVYYDAVGWYSGFIFLLSLFSLFSQSSLIIVLINKLFPTFLSPITNNFIVPSTISRFCLIILLVKSV